MQPFSYYNGTYMPTEKVSVPLTDIGFLRGFGIFDYIKVYNGVPFLLQEHLDRLQRSAKKMGLRVPYSDKEITTTIHNLLEKYPAPRAAIRIILTGGQAKGLSFEGNKETFIIATEVLNNLSEELYKNGAKLITHEHERVFPEVKTLNYITAVSLQKKREKKKAVEILYIYKGRVLEATTSNFFLVKGKKLITSRNTILIGITRNHILKLAKKRGFTIVERDIMLNELWKVDEAFITATNKEVLPIVNVDGRKIGNGKVGKQTQLLMQAFQESVQHYVKDKNK
jgi:D-amino acid aminotransferase